MPASAAAATAAAGAMPASATAGLEWPAIVQPAGRTLLAAQFQFDRSQWFAPADLAQQQLTQLRELVAFALDQVPHYRAAIRATLPHLMHNPRSLSWEDFTRWPVLKKAELRGREAALRPPALPPGHGEVFESSTTGSTGVPVKLYSSTVTQFLRSALVMRHHLWHELDFSLKYAEITPEAPGRSRFAQWGRSPAVAYTTGPSACIPVSAPLLDQLDWLIDEAPAYLQVKGSNLRTLLLLSQKTGRKPKGLRALLTLSENLPPELRVMAREVWGAPILDAYSCGEAGMLAIQCPGREHYHLQTEVNFVEILDGQGQPCAPGEIGRVVVTDLCNFAMPLIRYELGDHAEAGPPCECGRGLPVVTRVLGRTRNMATDPTGRVFWPSFPAQFWIDAAPIHQVQLVQHEPAAIEVRYVMDRELGASERERIAAALRKRMGYDFAFRFVRVEAILRASREKFEDFICHCLPAP